MESGGLDLGYLTQKPTRWSSYINRKRCVFKTTNKGKRQYWERVLFKLVTYILRKVIILVAFTHTWPLSSCRNPFVLTRIFGTKCSSSAAASYTESMIISGILIDNIT